MRHNGRKISIRSNRWYTIVGVTPEGFYGTEKFLQPDVFVPMANEALPLLKAGRGDREKKLQAENENHPQ